VTKHYSSMSYADFEVDDKVVGVYLPSVARKLRETLGASHVQIYEHTVGQVVSRKQLEVNLTISDPQTRPSIPCLNWKGVSFRSANEYCAHRYVSDVSIIARH
jgi:hypothetical protein